jgi:ethanolamine utilization cobalamin adenosyltransferase
LAAFPEELDDFLDSLPGFAFYQDLMDVIKQSDTSVFQMEENEQAWYFIHYILSDDGLAYARQPKAFLKFHRYGKKSITALEEHLKEAEVYAQGKNEIPEVHFTISPQHLQAFSALTNQLQEKYQVNITYSFQKPETDTVMIYKDNDEIVRDNQNQIVFRPGGHGALIDNIQDLDADIIFVKNIDNLQKGEKQADTLKFKRF